MMRLLVDGLNILCDERWAVRCGNRVRAAGTTTPDHLSQEARLLGWRASIDDRRRDLCPTHYSRALSRFQLIDTTMKG